MGSQTQTIDLSIIIVSWNVKDYLKKCLDSILLQNQEISYEIFVIDNGSQDASPELLQTEYSQLNLIFNKDNPGFAKANNQALKKCRGRYSLLLNPDTLLKDKALKNLVNFMDQHPAAGAAAPQLLNADGSIQPSCRSFPSLATYLWNALFFDQLFPRSEIFGKYLMTYWKHHHEREVDQPMGAALLIRKEALAQIGLLDENLFLLFDEVDWCWRLKKAGWKIYFTPAARVIHFGGRSIGQRPNLSNGLLFTRSKNYYFKKHFGILSVIILSLLDLLKIGLILAAFSIIIWIPLYLILK